MRVPRMRMRQLGTSGRRYPSTTLLLWLLVLTFLGREIVSNTRSLEAFIRTVSGASHLSKSAPSPETRDPTTGSTPYTPEALKKNPYLGWQPKASHPEHNGNTTFSVRECFKNDPKNPSSKQPYGCSERPDELGPAPPVESDWIPDVTMIRKMLMYGKDLDGQDFPPPLAEEYCENIGVQGGRSGDTNKECVLESMIRSTGPLNSTTVTIHPFNHYGALGENATDKGVTVPAPRLMCLVYTMADAHSDRIRAMRETWAGGCDGFLAFSTESDPRLPAISLEHEGPESYGNSESDREFKRQVVEMTEAHELNFNLPQCGKKSGVFGGSWEHIIWKTTTSFF